MSLWDTLFGGEVDSHRDGSTTERFSDGESITRNADGSTREATSHETVFPLGIGERITVTRDGKGNVVNTQSGWGKK